MVKVTSKQCWLMTTLFMAVGVTMLLLTPGGNSTAYGFGGNPTCNGISYDPATCCCSAELQIICQ